MNISVT